MAKAKFNSWAKFRVGDRVKLISLAKHPDESDNWLRHESDIDKKRVYYGKVVTVERVYYYNGLTWADFAELYYSHPIQKFKKVKHSRKK